MAQLMKLATGKDTEEKIFRQWLAVLPTMYAGIVKFVSYDDFKGKLTGSDIDTRPAEEILAEAREAEKWVTNGSI